MQIIRVFATVATMAATASAQACPAVNSSYGFYGANSATAAAAARLDGEGLCTPIIQPVNDVCVQCRPAAIPICNCPQGKLCTHTRVYLWSRLGFSLRWLDGDRVRLRTWRMCTFAKRWKSICCTSLAHAAIPALHTYSPL